MRGKRKFFVTTDSKHNSPIAPNLLQRNFTTMAPNQVWTGDITYIQTNGAWLYLAVVLDLFNRQVVGFSMQNHMRASLVADALRMAWSRRHLTKPSHSSSTAIEAASITVRLIRLSSPNLTLNLR